MRVLAAAFSLLLALASTGIHAQDDELTPEQRQYVEWAQAIWDSLDRQQGEITLPNGVARLNVPEGFYYLSPADAEKILVQAWENPPGAGSKTLGMLFPEEGTPFDNESWGVTIEYEEDGYVADDDADSIDYDELLVQMKEGTAEASKQRVSQGYEPIALVGWASRPFYDATTHKLHWAKEVKFGDQEVNTLNYNIRVLGRKGVLVLNFIAGMDRKAVIESSLDTVLAMAEFDSGNRYEDFDPDLDQVAAYGLGALVAGKVLTKTGILAAVLLFGKKFGVIFLVALGAVVARIFKRKKAA